MKKHINDVPDGIIRPESKRIRYLSSDHGKNTENDIFKLKLHEHGNSSMVSAQQAVLSSGNCPEDIQMVMPFVFNDDDADDDIKTISGTQLSRVNSIRRYQTRADYTDKIKLQTW